MPEHTANDPTTEKILTFKAKLDQADKIDETMSIDSAVWYIEAALNYTHCYFTENMPETNSISVDSISFPENFSGEIAFKDVREIYNEFEGQLVKAFEEFDNDTKYISVIDISFSEQKIHVTYGFNFVNETSKYDPPLLWNIITDDIYEYTNQFVRAPITGYFTDIDSAYFEPPHHFETNNNPYGDYLLFYNVQTCPGIEPILTQNQYDYYESSCLEAVTIVKSQVPAGNTFMAWEFRSHGWHTTNNICHRVHQIKMWYGILTGAEAP